MRIHKTAMDGVFSIDLPCFNDARGRFVKTYRDDVLQQCGIQTKFYEGYFSVSEKNVLRGMHFQLPPHHHDKLVSHISGDILDVVLDLRTTSKTYGKTIAFELNDQKRMSIFVPAGCAHGFLSRSSGATLQYLTSSLYSQEYDSGILWNSFGFPWPIESPILSNRDQDFISLQDFSSPFNE